MERTESVLEERTAPSPEVLERPVRRRLAEADICDRLSGRRELPSLAELIRVAAAST